MTLAETLLTSLAEARPSSEGRQFHHFNGDDWEVRLLNERTETLGSLICEMDLKRHGESPEGLTLNTWAHGVASRVTGLLEPLKVLEIDQERQLATLRSDGPTVKGDERHYYEVQLSGTTHASVRRYVGNPVQGGPRQPQSFALTHEVLAKLVKDITG
jgi:hypothetical protein